MKRPQPSPDTQPHRLKHYRHRWDEVGITTFPLNENDKTPVCNDWQTRLPEDMWAEAEQRPDTANAQHNIAVRAGQLSTSPDTSLAIIDMDNATSRRNTEARLTGYGLETANVRTASRSGRHAYLLTSGVPHNFNYANLNASIGKGELRAGSGAYVTAPCSEVDGNSYIFTQGNIESLMTQQVVEWSDLQWLLPETLPQPDTIKRLPLRLQHRTMPTYTLSLFEWCATAEKGKGYSKYQTRSEVEAAIVAQLISCGWELSEVIKAFEYHQPLHYVEQGKTATRYLARTYSEVVTWMSNTPVRHNLTGLYHDAPQAFYDIGGRTSLTDLAIFQALIAHCWRHNTAAVHAAQRDLAEHAASAHRTVGKALARLQAHGCVIFLKAANKKLRHGGQYGVVGLPSSTKVSISIHKSQKAAASSKQVSVNSVSSKADKGLAAKYSGLWGVRAGMGRSCKAVHKVLTDEPQTVTEIMVKTGKVRNTVKKALTELQQLGATSQVDGGFIVGEHSMQELCHVLGAQDLTTQRRNNNELQRKAYRRWVETSGTVTGSKG